MTMDAHTSAIFWFYTGNTLFGQIWSKILKFSVQVEIWYLDVWYLGGVHFLCFRLETPFLGKFGSTNQNFSV